MSFRLNVRKVDGVVILDFSGRFTIGEPVETALRVTRLHFEEGARKFVWNLRELEFIDSAALGAVVSEYTIIQSKGGEVKLLLHPS
jgi:anti-anti-sigma factor